MILPMQFLKQIGLLAHSMQPRYMTIMNVRNIIERFQERQDTYGAGMAVSFYHRTTVLQGLCHAKTMLTTQGTASFTDYFKRLFTPDPKEPKKFVFKK